MSYTPDPTTRNLPISSVELEEIVTSKGRGVLKNAASFLHLLARFQATMTQHRHQITALHAQIQRMQLEQSHAGAATTMHPIDAVRFLSPEELRAVMEPFLRQKFDVTQRNLAAARALQSELSVLVNGLRFQLAGLLDDPNVPAHTRAQVTALLEAAERASKVPSDDSSALPAPRRPVQLPDASDTTKPSPGEATPDDPNDLSSLFG
jgi:hypothetical protein